MAFRLVERESRLWWMLTDMWRAAGSPEGKEPWRWLETEQAKEFIELICENSNLAKNEVIETERGRNRGTWAHWQPGLAFAKYLSPEFHAWCNDVVRMHMEGRGGHHRARATSAAIRCTVPVPTP
jgi:hypothetical protein